MAAYKIEIRTSRQTNVAKKANAMIKKVILRTVFHRNEYSVQEFSTLRHVLFEGPIVKFDDLLVDARRAQRRITLERALVDFISFFRPLLRQFAQLKIASLADEI